MIGYYAEVTPDGRYIQCISQEMPSEWTPEPGESANTLYPVNAPVTGVPPTPTSELFFIDGEAKWIETATLDEVKARKREEINAAYRLANDTSFTFAGKEIQADAHAMKQITITHGGIVGRGALKADWSGYWKALDNTYVAIPDVATWWEFYDSIEATGQANFNKAQALKAQLDAAETFEAIAEIKW